MPEDRQAAMADLKGRCAALLQGAHAPRGSAAVMGEGNLHAAVALVGEAPGEQEALQGRPFVGKAGKNLDGFLGALGLLRKDIWITNVVKFRPVKEHPRMGTLSNRPPTRGEIDLFFGVLAGELSIVRPRAVVTLGNVALRAVSGDWKAVIGDKHAKPEMLELYGLKFTLFPLYHPASIIYNRALAETYEDDLNKLRECLVGMGIIN
jgi:uracil-DNA glycosylase